MIAATAATRPASDSRSSLRRVLIKGCSAVATHPYGGQFWRQSVMRGLAQPQGTPTGLRRLAARDGSGSASVALRAFPWRCAVSSGSRRGGVSLQPEESTVRHVLQDTRCVANAPYGFDKGRVSRCRSIDLAPGATMSPLRFDMLIITVVAAGAVIAGVYLFMISVPRNDDEHLHDGISEPGHMKTRLLRALARIRRRVSR